MCGQAKILLRNFHFFLRCYIMNDNMSELDPAVVKNLKVADLKAELSIRNLPTTGKKDELASRLLGSLGLNRSMGDDGEVENAKGNSTTAARNQENNEKEPQGVEGAKGVEPSNTGGGYDDSFLEFLDGVATPTKDQTQKRVLGQGLSGFDAPHSYFGTIHELVQTNTLINKDLAAERENNRKLMEENFYLKLKIFDLQNEGKLHQESPVQSTPSTENVTVNNSQELGNSEKIANQLKSVLLEKHREYMLLRSNDPGNQNNNKRENANKESTSNNESTNNVKSAQNNNRKSKKKRNKERETKAQQQEKICNQAQSATAPCKQQQQQQQQNNGKAVTPRDSANSDSNSNQAGRKIHTWPNDTALITGDSIISGLRENKFDGPGKIKVRSFPGATILDMKDHIKPLIRKKPSKIILHVSTNDAADLNADEILADLLDLKKDIETQLQTCQVIISLPTLRLDNKKANKTLEALKQKIRSLHLDHVDNDNINEGDLSGPQKLHLNFKGTEKLACNFVDKLCF